MPPQLPSRPDDLDDLVLRAIGGEDPQPEVILLGGLAGELQRRDEDSRTDVHRDTALLQAIDVLVLKPVAEVIKLVDANPERDDWSQEPDRSRLERLMWLSRVASDLRARRRKTVAAAFDVLRDTGDLEIFAHNVIEPLLCRPWLPHLTYASSMSIEREPLDGLWNRRAEKAFAALSYNTSLGVFGLSSLLDHVDRLPPNICPLGGDTAAYLRTALAVWEAQPEGVPVTAPILFRPSGSTARSWPLGHIVDILIVPQETPDHPSLRATQRLVNESLTPARRAVTKFLRRDAGFAMQLEALGTALALGDYPGGGEPIRHVSGPSAGLALAAAILGRLCGLTWRDGVLTTAAISDEGQIESLHDEDGLRKKGRAVGLWGGHSIAAAGDVHGVSDDGQELKRGAETVGCNIGVLPAETLADLAGTVLVDPYAAMLTRISTMPSVRIDASLTFSDTQRQGFDQTITHLARRTSDDRLILGIPWSTLPADHSESAAHILAQTAIARSLAVEALKPLRTRRSIPILLDTETLAPLFPADPETFLDIVAREVAPVGTTLQPFIREHLRSGDIVLLIAGLADVDQHGQYLSDAQARQLLEAFDTFRVRRILLVARGYGTADAPIIARRDLLTANPKCFAVQWLAPSTVPPHHSLMPHQEETLTQPNGAAFGQLLPLQIAIRTLSEHSEVTSVQRLRLALQFLYPPTPATDTKTIVPRILQRFQPASIGELRPSGPLCDESKLHALLDASNGPGVILLDGEEREGGTGKSTLLLSLLAAAYQDGRPALFVSLGDLHQWNEYAGTGDLLTFLLYQKGLATDAAIHDLLLAHPKGVLVILDGLNEVVPSARARFAMDVAPLLKHALRGVIHGIHVVVGSRAEEWLATTRVLEHPADLPAPAQIRAAFTESQGDGMPTLLRLEPLQLDEAIAYLWQFPYGTDLLAALGDAHEALLPHPFTLGLLTMIGYDHEAPSELAACSQARGQPYQWDIVKIVVDYLLARGQEPNLRAHRGNLEKPLLNDSERARALLQALAYAMARDKMPLDPDVSREVVRTTLDTVSVEMQRLRRAQIIEEGRNQGQTSDEIARRLDEVMRAFASPPAHLPDDVVTRILGDLRAMSVVLSGTALIGYRLAHELLRDVLGSIALRARRDPDRDEVAFYEEQIAASRGNPTLRATVRMDLLRRCQEGHFMLIEALCRSESDDVRGVMITVLRQHGREEKQSATHAFLRRLLSASLATRVMRRHRPLLARGDLASALVAIAVAGGIGANDLLSEMLRSPLDILRGEAIRQTYFLWQREPTAALAVLEPSIHRVPRMLVTLNIPGIEACATLSLLVMADLLKRDTDARYQQLGQQLRGFWLDALKGLPLQQRSPVERFARTKLIQTLVRRTLVRLPTVQRYTASSVAELSHAFGADNDRAAFLRLASYIDQPGNYDAMRQDILEVAVRRNDLLGAYTADWVLTRFYRVDRDAALTLIWDLYETAEQLMPQGLLVGNLGFVLFNLQRHFRTLPHDTMRRYLARIDDYLDEYKGVIRGNSPDISIINGLDAAILYDLEIYGRPRAHPLIQKYFSKAMHREDQFDDQFLVDGLWTLQQLRHEPRYYQALLANLVPLFNYGTEEKAGDKARQVHQTVVALVAALRAVQPVEVDAFLEKSGAAQQFIDVVDTVSASETTMRDIVMGGIAYWLPDILIYLAEDDALRQRMLVPSFAAVATSRSLDEWITTVITIGLDELYRD